MLTCTQNYLGLAVAVEFRATIDVLERWASRQAAHPYQFGAFSSKVGTGLRRENATKKEDGAFSSKVGTGLRRENATKKEDGAPSARICDGPDVAAWLFAEGLA